MSPEHVALSTNVLPAKPSETLGYVCLSDKEHQCDAARTVTGYLTEKLGLFISYFIFTGS